MPPYGAKMGPEGGSTQVNATEALLVPGPRLKIEENHAPHGAKMGPEGGSTQASATEALLLPGPRLKIEGNHAPIWRQDGSRRGVNPGQCN